MTEAKTDLNEDIVSEQPLENSNNAAITDSSLPGSVHDSPNQLDNQLPQDIINRPESRLEVDTEGVATLSDPSAPPQRLPPLKGSQDGDGLEGYRQDLNLIEGSSTPGGSEFNSLRPSRINGPRLLLTDANINQLLNTLECPVCLDTADTPPIYQCPEGHLLCRRCNQRLVDCPQCGHALMNSRNRTAEDLAIKLQMLRGSSASVVDGHKMSIAVSEPHKAKGIFFGGVLYTIITKYGDENGENFGNKTFYSVTRTYNDIVNLYQFLMLSYKKDGVVIPPPPIKGNLGLIEKVTTVRSENLSSSSASRSIDKKCVALDRYMKRLSKHPVVRKDAMFKAFLHEKDVAKTLKPLVTMKGAMNNFKRKFNLFKSKITVKEKDPWFQARQVQLKSLYDQMDEMNKNLKGMAKLKHELHEKSDEFRRDLVSLLVGRSSVRANDLSQVIDNVVDATRIMSSIYEEQGNADDHIVQISGDYKLMVIAAQDVLSRRKKVQMDLELEVKKAKKLNKSVAPLKEASSEAPVIGMDEQSATSSLDRAQIKFDNLSQTLRRELEHFDFVMRDEFEKAFAAYSATYWSSLSKTKNFDGTTGGLNTRATTPRTGTTRNETLALNYEDMSAVSYHM